MAVTEFHKRSGVGDSKGDVEDAVPQLAAQLVDVFPALHVVQHTEDGTTVGGRALVLLLYRKSQVPPRLSLVSCMVSTMKHVHRFYGNRV